MTDVPSIVVDRNPHGQCVLFAGVKVIEPRSKDRGSSELTTIFMGTDIVGIVLPDAGVLPRSKRSSIQKKARAGAIPSVREADPFVENRFDMLPSHGSLFPARALGFCILRDEKNLSIEKNDSIARCV